MGEKGREPIWKFASWVNDRRRKKGSGREYSRGVLEVTGRGGKEK